MEYRECKQTTQSLFTQNAISATLDSDTQDDFH